MGRAFSRRNGYDNPTLAVTFSADGIIARMPAPHPVRAVPAMRPHLLPAPSAWAPTPPHSPAAVTKGFGVMSTRPAHGDFDELPAHTVALTHAFSIGITQSRPPSSQQFDPTYKPHAVYSRLCRRRQLGAGHGLLRWLTKKTGKP